MRTGLSIAIALAAGALVVALLLTRLLWKNTRVRRWLGLLPAQGAEGEDAAVFVAADEAPDEDPESASNAADPGRTEDPLADIYGWQSLRVSREERCAKCDTAIARGTPANLGQSDVPGAARRWLCDACMEAW